MAIVKAIADAHNATLELDSGPDCAGLVVSIRFPGAAFRKG